MFDAPCPSECSTAYIINAHYYSLRLRWNTFIGDFDEQERGPRNRQAGHSLGWLMIFPRKIILYNKKKSIYVFWWLCHYFSNCDNNNNNFWTTTYSQETCEEATILHSSSSHHMSRMSIRAIFRLKSSLSPSLAYFYPLCLRTWKFTRIFCTILFPWINNSMDIE